MGDLKARLAPLFRRSSSASSSASANSNALEDKRNRSKTSLLLSKSRKSSLGVTPITEEAVAQPPAVPRITEGQFIGGEREQTPDPDFETPRTTPLEDSSNPVLTVQAPTPDLLTAVASTVIPETGTSGHEPPVESDAGPEINLARPDVARRQSITNNSQKEFLETLLESEKAGSQAGSGDFLGPPLSASMLHRKIWVKRSGASATLVSINEDDLVDDVRDRILKKYANSLGRSFDAPDVTLRIMPREHSHPHRQSYTERTLGPDEPMSRTLDSYYPGGQKVEEALVIDVPRRTPRHSPRPVPYYTEDQRPMESASDYFPVMPAGQHSPHLPSTLAVGTGHNPAHHLPMHSISVLNTGQVPPLPSPGAARGLRHPHRPKYGRTHTTSPTVLSTASGSQSHETQKPHSNGVPAPPPIPTPPLPTDVPHRTATPPPRSSSPGTKPTRTKRKPKADTPKLPAGLLDGAVPPISVLIVEDNIINLKLLEAFMKRLKVRWHTAMNGREAVTKWRAGGFHLVLMDIQLPVMNGLDATKEIRRLERVNNIGVFSGSAASTPTTFGGTDKLEEGRESEKPEGDDNLVNSELFKSPVIIVALTASSLQSDRHEALAAGCNDFLTKPVNFVWLERKVTEWGCMQALIDFDGWRKWKDFSNTTTNTASDSAAATKSKDKPLPTNNTTSTGNNSSSSNQENAPAIPAVISPNNSKTLKRDPTGTTKRFSSATEGLSNTSGSGTGSGSDGIESGDGGAIAAGA
ncbi:MAG: hypothetical protein Q9191_007022 [Dirinaria sp. TL-2023a]